jgi:hypothetical protein
VKRALYFWREWAVVGVAVLILALAYRFKGPTTAAAFQDQRVDKPAVTAVPLSPTADVSEPQEVSEFATASPLRAEVPPADGEEAGAISETPPVEPMSDPRQLVASLARLDLGEGITREQAGHWKQQLATLIQQGAAAVPAIREFLAQNQEISFDAARGGEFLGQHSLRAAFFDVLQQIGGPEAEALMLQTLQTTTLPSEIALLAHQVDRQAPGQYRQEILNAAQEALSMSEKGQLPDWDVGPLFKLLQQFGDTSTVATLEQFRSQWSYYATLSLAGMPGGEGVPSLVRQAQDAASGTGMQRELAFQMLAQASAQYPDAAGALLEQARLNQIPDSAWRRIAAGLAGDRYGIGLPPEINPVTRTLRGLKTYHIESGNQNFYSLASGAGLSAAETHQRIALLDQLRAMNLNPAAAAALQAARDSLSVRIAAN